MLNDLLQAVESWEGGRMIIAKPHLLTKLEIWYPKYGDTDGWEVWISKQKAHHASSVMIIEFTKAKHLKGQRFCVTRDAVTHSPSGTNGKIAVYKVPFERLEGYDTAQEVIETVNNIFGD